MLFCGKKLSFSLPIDPTIIYSRQIEKCLKQIERMSFTNIKLDDYRIKAVLLPFTIFTCSFVLVDHKIIIIVIVTIIIICNLTYCNVT